MLIRTTSILAVAALTVCGCDGKTAAENHREAAGQEAVGGVKEAVGGFAGDKSLRRDGQEQTDRGRTNEKIGDVKDAVHNVVH